jgi:hypothetical protein
LRQQICQLTSNQVQTPSLASLEWERVEERQKRSGEGLYASPLAANQPPNPMEIAPAINSARPPKMTILLLPRADSPAVRAKGTVRPSERPIVASDMTRGSIELCELDGACTDEFDANGSTPVSILSRKYVDSDECP